NDIGAGRPLSATLLTGPAHGKLALQTDGSFVYTPDADYFGIDTFTYRASDSNTLDASGASNLPGYSNTATVWLYVRPTHPAFIAGDDFYTTTQNKALDITPGGVTSNDQTNDVVAPTPPSPLLTLNAPSVYIPRPTPIASLLTGPAHGTLTLNED